MHRKAKLISCIGICTLTVSSVPSMSNPIDLSALTTEHRITHQEQGAENPTFSICEKLGDFLWKKLEKEKISVIQAANMQEFFPP